jgi:hypothetical protein
MTVGATRGFGPRSAEAIRSFVAYVRRGRVKEDGAAGLEGIGDREWDRRTIEGLTVVWRRRSTDADRSAIDALPTLLLGDDSEWDTLEPDRNLAGGVPIRLDEAARSLVVHTSIVGLPPIYLYDSAEVIAVASDIHLLSRIPGVELALDPASVEELGRIGHPVGHRTLFQRVTLVPSGSRLELTTGAVLRRSDSWSLPEREVLDWPEFLQSQISAFQASLRRFDLEGAFLSLTAGLDTRTVFGTLLAEGRGLPAATMTGPKRSLDARTAARICRAYGLRHEEIVFDERFTRDLPRFVETSSLLSGGMASLDQAPEVYFYHALDGRYQTRLSGNLGNQVGRGGTEGVSTRGADTSILSGDLRSRAASGDKPSGHWLVDELRSNPRARTEFILKNEIAFTLASNYPIGNHYAKQQTPYASRELIETLSQQPRTAVRGSESLLRMRLRDLAHRFLGEPADVSFQRTLLRRIGGFVAHYPINWGWRANGGVSLSGLTLGAATLFGMYARARGLDGGILRPFMDFTGLPALHDFRESRRWLRAELRDYTFDTLTSSSTSASGLFDHPALSAVLQEHFGGKHDHYTTVTFALDVALARNLPQRREAV